MTDIIEAGNARRLRDLREAIARDDGPEYAKFLLAELDRALETIRMVKAISQTMDNHLKSLDLEFENLSSWLP